MGVLVNFIIPVLGSSYGNIIQSIIDPVRIHLPESIVTQRALPKALNVHFFLEKAYYSMVFDKGLKDFSIGKNIYMEHGISDKCYLDKSITMYDYVLVHGPVLADKARKQNVSDDKIITIGYPRLDPIFQGLVKKNKRDKKQVLWAPTHYNTIASSYPDFEAYLNGFPADFEVNTSLHPYHKNNLTPTSMQQLADADVIISDTSSIIYEAWAIDKPVVFPDWLVKQKVFKYFPNSVEEKIYQERIGFHADSFPELLKQTEMAFHKGIDSKASELMEDIFPARLRGLSGKRCADVLKKLSEQ